jgi:hypothetical protein
MYVRDGEGLISRETFDHRLRSAESSRRKTANHRQEAHSAAGKVGRSRRKLSAPVLSRALCEEKRLMKTQVEFRSDQFPPYDGEEEQINPGLWGKRLAEFLQERLPKHGLKVTGIVAEDWGWMVELEDEGFPLWVGCGHQRGDSDEFLCFIEPSKPFIRKWFRKIDTSEQVGRVSNAMRKILESNPEIRSINWTPVTT